MRQLALPLSAHRALHMLRMGTLVRRMLALYLCALAVAFVSPWVHAHQRADAFPTPALEQICTDHSVQWQFVAGQATSIDHADHLAIEHLLDCPMCLPAALPVAADVIASLPPRIGIHPAQRPSTALPATSATPFLARAPPV